MDVRTGLYRIYDDADRLLYVGISTELIAATIWMEADVRAWAKRTGRKVAA